MLVAFSTYHSIRLISDAQHEAGAPRFDLMFCDEAHRTTGAQLIADRDDDRGTSVFLMPHHDRFVKAEKRIYMTATPKIWSAKSESSYRNAEVFSMDDESQFGPVFYKMKFSEAIDKGLLSDYYLVGLTIDPAWKDQVSEMDLHPELTAGEQAKLYGAVKGVSFDENDVPHLRRSISFTNTIKRSLQHQLSMETASERLREMALENNKTPPYRVRTQHIEGKTKANIRRQRLDWLKEPEDDECRIVTNARCLSEGVDVPTLDATLFMSPKHSVIDIVQQVGRVMRKAPGKTHGYIVVPIMLAEGDTAQDALRKSEDYATIIKVVRALRSHDDNIDQLINQNRFSEKLRLVPVPAAFGEQDTELTTQEREEAIQEALFAPADLIEAMNVLVFQDCGDRQYWTKWAKDVGEQTIALQNKILSHLATSKSARARFDQFMTGIRETISHNMTEQEAIGMLAQHLVTKPVFDAFFENYEFSATNPISQIMNDVIDEIVSQKLTSSLQRSMNPFYESVQKRIRDIDDPDIREKVFKELYETFLTTAFPVETERLGVVYTPKEIVDWLLHSADDALRQEFGVGLEDENVEILDPFSGTGTFLTRLIKGNLISNNRLDYKYEKEMFAIDIWPLPYYLSAINIEEAYQGRRQELGQKEYKRFQGIVLGDTFTLTTDKKLPLGKFGMEESNTPTLNRINNRRIKVIVGNPPWRAWQSNLSKQNPNKEYEDLDNRITQTYALKSRANNKNSLYDTYYKALRWASDRIKDGGVIAFVTNGGWLDGTAASGVRATLAEEFSSIYCYNLRGKIPSTKEEGGNVFNVKVSVTMVIMIKNPQRVETSKIFYTQTTDGLSGKQKLQELLTNNSLSNTNWEPVIPDVRYDWINKTNFQYQNYQVLGDRETKRKISKDGMFVLYSSGIKTKRDPWAYNSDLKGLQNRTKRMIQIYNKQIKSNNSIDLDRYQNIIKWYDELLVKLNRKIEAKYSVEKFRSVMYRPFYIQFCHYDPIFNQRHHQLNHLFPSNNVSNMILNISGRSAQDFDCFMTKHLPDLHLNGGGGRHFLGTLTTLPNLAMCVMDKPGTREFSVLMTTKTPDLELVHHGQVFSLWRYRKIGGGRQGGIFDGVEAPEGYVVEDNILDETLDAYREYYDDDNIEKDDIFYYVYGILHHPAYKSKYRNDLRKGLPRIPKAPDFWAFAEAGRKLGRLHVDYPELDGYPLEQDHSVLFDPANDDHYRFEKLKMTVTDKDTAEIRINEHLTLIGIPKRALDYIVNGKSGLGWIVDRYRIHVDTKHGSGIINDANKLFDDPRDFIKLVEQVTQVSLESVNIIDSLPAQFEPPETG